jgi:hypothetical protein
MSFGPDVLVQRFTKTVPSGATVTETNTLTVGGVLTAAQRVLPNLATPIRVLSATDMTITLDNPSGSSATADFEATLGAGELASGAEPAQFLWKGSTPGGGGGGSVVSFVDQALIPKVTVTGADSPVEHLITSASFLVAGPALNVTLTAPFDLSSTAGASVTVRIRRVSDNGIVAQTEQILAAGAILNASLATFDGLALGDTETWNLTVEVTSGAGDSVVVNTATSPNYFTAQGVVVVI